MWIPKSEEEITSATASGLEETVTFHWMPRFAESDYKRAVRVSAAAIKENPKQFAAQLVMPLISAISQGTDNPFV